MQNNIFQFPDPVASILILTAALLSCLGVLAYFRGVHKKAWGNPGYWLLMVSALVLAASAQGVFLNANMPPPFVLAMAPMAIATIILGLSRYGAENTNRNLALLALISVVRIPVEIALHSLAEARMVPVAMTWSGSNFDIISGVTALPVAWLVSEGRMPRMALVAWNLLCLALLANVVITGILSAPMPFQKLNFDQPNRALLMFPYALLPFTIVTTVLFSHLKSLRILRGSAVAKAKERSLAR